MTENTKREIPDDILVAEGMARADEGRVEIFRGMAAQNSVYQADLDKALADAKESNKHVARLRGEIDDAPEDLSGVMRGLSDSEGNFAENLEVLTAGGTGVEASNTDKSTGEPATSADDAGTETAQIADADGPVEIPDDWEGRPWQTRVALAKRISGRDEVKTDEANDIIAAEVAKRG